MTWNNKQVYLSHTNSKQTQMLKSSQVSVEQDAIRQDLK